ncbi:class I SAM-dependent methyltransferase [Actinobacillus arthritidis]|uniref:class I SAM-dependent methyltransferase n=1 Tax=Actinobacillus arthritidis TaxID=157339 RepID=UPI0024421409|nr:class I SAM-dependent methyltransferase [Actinobacillus arthritidis]WGE90007.1 class I SAM-dependent methyltransferase [Actinobacillus arthritidis]
MDFSLNHHLLQDITHYWNYRAETYSQENLAELNSSKSQIWQQLILSHAPQTNTPLKILDIGTGPGFFAILMAQAGHQVTAIDATVNMLQKAQANAEQANVEITFVQGDVHQLPFDNEQFDLIVTRNVTWNLNAPEQAYQDWYRVLKTGGRLINFDANWYLHLFDEAFQKGFEQDRVNTVKNAVVDHYADPNTKKMDEIARQLPLSQIIRPQWDAQTLLNLGFRQLMIDTQISEIVWNLEEKINGASTPMFMIVAQK